MNKIIAEISGSKAILRCERCGEKRVVPIDERFDLTAEKTKFNEEHICRE